VHESDAGILLRDLRIGKGIVEWCWGETKNYNDVKVECGELI
jgi:hypothetical protein